MDAAELVRGGDLDAALKAVIEDVRRAPADAKHRVFLFQLLCVTGDYARAKTHLDVARGLDPGTLLMAQVYGDALACEAERTRVFAGEVMPTLFGEPEPWMAKLLEALRLSGKGEAEAAAALRLIAYDEAPAGGGTVGDQRFEWIADGDSRIGPMLEIITKGKYYWLPFMRISSLTVEPPTDLRDLVWAAAEIRLTNGGEVLGFIPSRYPGSEASPDPLIRLGRKTDWRELSEDAYAGLGQRMLVTDTGDLPLLDLRKLEFDPPLPAESAGHGE